MLSSNATRSYSAWIYVYPDHGYKGVDVYVSGDNFAADSTVYIYFDDKLIATADTDRDGWFEEYIEIPANAAPGIHTIKAVDQSGIKAIKSFTVTIPTLYINASSAEPYSIVRATGSGYAAYQWYLVAVDDLIVNSFIMARGNETIDTCFPISPLPSGVHRVNVVYVSLATVNHIVVASRKLRIIEGYVDNFTYTSTLNKIFTGMKRLSEKLSVIQDNLEHLSMTVKEIKTGLNELVSNHTILRKKWRTP